MSSADCERGGGWDCAWRCCAMRGGRLVAGRMAGERLVAGGREAGDEDAAAMRSGLLHVLCSQRRLSPLLRLLGSLATDEEAALPPLWSVKGGGGR